MRRFASPLYYLSIAGETTFKPQDRISFFRPTGKKDGSIEVDVRVNPDLVKRVNGAFRGKWRNSGNIGKNEQEIMGLWNAKHPDDPIE